MSIIYYYLAYQKDYIHIFASCNTNMSMYVDVRYRNSFFTRLQSVLNLSELLAPRPDRQEALAWFEPNQMEPRITSMANKWELHREEFPMNWSKLFIQNPPSAGLVQTPPLADVSSFGTWRLRGNVDRAATTPNSLRRQGLEGTGLL